MPNDVKAYVSAAVALVAIILAYWSGSAGAAGIRKYRPRDGSLHDRRHVDFFGGWRKKESAERLA